jgi:hypothetical protein
MLRYQVFTRYSDTPNRIFIDIRYFTDVTSCLYLYCRVLEWLIRWSFEFGDWIYCTLYIHTLRDYRQYSAIAILHTFQLTVTHALESSVFTSRILATDSSQSHCHFNSHMKSSWHSLITFLSFLLNHLRLPSPELEPILFRLLFSTPCYSAFTTTALPNT